MLTIIMTSGNEYRVDDGEARAIEAALRDQTPASRSWALSTLQKGSLGRAKRIVINAQHIEAIVDLPEQPVRAEAL